MLPAMALVASGLQALVSSSVTGTRISVERKLFSRKSSANTIFLMSRLNSSVFVHCQYLLQQAKYPDPAQPRGSRPIAGVGSLLEWQCAQRSAKTILPCDSCALSFGR